MSRQALWPGIRWFIVGEGLSPLVERTGKAGKEKLKITDYDINRLTSIPDPEATANEWSVELNRIFNTRMNFWLTIEAVLVAAYAAVSGAVLGSYSAVALIAVSLAGIVFTSVFHSLTIRTWWWNDWYLNRAKELNKIRLGGGDPLVYPPDKEFGFWAGNGLGTRVASDLLLLLFVAVWLVLGWIAVDSLASGIAGLSLSSTRLLLQFLFVVMALAPSLFVLFWMIKRWQHD